MLIEERKSKKDLLIERLDEVSLGKIYDASFKAMMRLQMFFMMRTHELILAFGKAAEGEILHAGGKEGMLDGASGFALQSQLLMMWGDTWLDWMVEFQQARREAGRIAFGVQAVIHQRLVSDQWTALSKQKAESGMQISEAVVDGVYNPQLRILMDVAEEYLHGDALNLSGRIWRIDQEARNGINTAILNGIQNGSSAWDIAKQLEQFLGAGQGCPRWTSTRLYGRTKTEIADGDTTGLLNGADCNGSGVSYNALRLARTELQKIHSLATDRMMAQQPWVEAEQVKTSPAHGEQDECDAAAGGGENGDGVYPVGTVELPLHPNCLCYKTAVLMNEKDFSKRMKEWLNGGEWDEIDQYANDLGVPLDTNFMPAALSLAVWLFGEELSLKG
jgi:hypothetical protein